MNARFVTASRPTHFMSAPQPKEAWQIIAASVPGTKHRKRNTPCQDVLEFCVLDNGALVAALADGAGSASFAETGAAIAARTALNSMSQSLKTIESPSETQLREVLMLALSASRTSVIAEAEKRNVRPRELATTLIAAVFTDNQSASAQVGDGAVVIGQETHSYVLLTGPPITEHLNETLFLTSDSALDQAQVGLAQGPVRYASLLCDGLQMLALKYPELVPHAKFFAPLFAFLEHHGPGQQTAD
ncbi:MAG: protein phosphatase 2C domain-containing protein, partial [Verrucomicrobiae bacterium]|nr:protein phosphatase 2C domain-containing protein [Verrucomicrobiae bacterium]